MDIKYAVIKSRSFGYFLLICSIVIGFVAIGLPLLTSDSLNAKGLIISIIITSIPVGFFIWIWINTYYILNKEILFVKSGPIAWKVPIAEISIVRLNQKTIGGTWKPTLSWNCIEIKSKKYRSIFITPERQDDFISRLKHINKQIEIKEK